MKCGDDEKPAALSSAGLVCPSNPPNRSNTRPMPWLRPDSAAGWRGFQYEPSGIVTSTSG